MMKKTALIAVCGLAVTGVAFAGGPDITVTEPGTPGIVADGGLQNPTGVLYDNGTLDYANGLSSAGVGAFGARRSLLDDFRVPQGGWDVGGASTLLIWSSGARLVGTDLEIQFFENNGCAPGALVATAPTTSYLAVERDDLGDLFGRLIEQVDVTFDCINLPEGEYYMEMVSIGPENCFIATAPLNGCGECWVNYDDFGGLQPGSAVFGAEYDIVFSVMDCAGANCLDMIVTTPLVSGENATWDVSGANPGSLVVIVYGFNPGSTVINGFMNFCNPVAGHMIVGEYGHGAESLAGSTDGLALNLVDSTKKVITIEEVGPSNKGYQWKDLVFMAIGLLRTYTLGKWSIAFAGVAKVNTSAWRDQNDFNYHIKFDPYISPLINAKSNVVNTGATLIGIL